MLDVKSFLLFLRQLFIGGEVILDTSGFDCTHNEQASLEVSKVLSYGSKSTEQVRRGAGFSVGGVFRTPSSKQTRALYSGWQSIGGLRGRGL